MIERSVGRDVFFDRLEDVVVIVVVVVVGHVAVEGVDQDAGAEVVWRDRDGLGRRRRTQGGRVAATSKYIF